MTDNGSAYRAHKHRLACQQLGLKHPFTRLGDPRQLERWWGPPTYPATVVDHDLTPGGRTTYFMTGPDGDKHAGYWQITAVDEPFRGWQQDVAYHVRDSEEEQGIPVTRILPRALMIPPGFPDFLSRTRFIEAGPCTLEGRAWSGWAPGGSTARR